MGRLNHPSIDCVVLREKGHRLRLRHRETRRRPSSWRRPLWKTGRRKSRRKETSHICTSPTCPMVVWISFGRNCPCFPCRCASFSLMRWTLFIRIPRRQPCVRCGYGSARRCCPTCPVWWGTCILGHPGRVPEVCRDCVSAVTPVRAQTWLHEYLPCASAVHQKLPHVVRTQLALHHKVQDYDVVGSRVDVGVVNYSSMFHDMLLFADPWSFSPNSDSSAQQARRCS